MKKQKQKQTINIKAEEKKETDQSKNLHHEAKDLKFIRVSGPAAV